MKYEEIIIRYRVSYSTILRWVRRFRETGSYAALPMGGQKPFVLADQWAWLLDQLSAKPDLTLRAVLAALSERGIAVSYFAVWNAVHRARLSFKKNLSTPASRTAPMLRADAGCGASIKTG